ncbi:hypothetical protein [Nostoc sp.]
MLEKPLIMSVAKDFLNLTYTNSQKSLLSAIDNMLSELPGGQEWKEG